MPFTEDDKKEFQSIIEANNASLIETILKKQNESLNAALTARDARLKEAFGKSIADHFEGVAREVLSEEEINREEPEQPNNGGEPRTAQKVTDSPEYKAQQRRLDALEKQVRDAEEARAAAQKKTRETTKRTKAQEALAAAGFDPAAVGDLLDILEARGRLRMEDDSENILFKDDKGDELPLIDGINEFKKTEGAKRYLPARGAKGSGDARQGAKPTTAAGADGAPLERGAIGKMILGLHQAQSSYPTE